MPDLPRGPKPQAIGRGRATAAPPPVPAPAAIPAAPGSSPSSAASPGSSPSSAASPGSSPSSAASDRAAALSGTAYNQPFVLFFDAEELDTVQRAAEMDGKQPNVWASDAVIQVARSRVAFEDRDLKKHDEEHDEEHDQEHDQE